MDNYFEEASPEAKETLDAIAKEFGKKGYVKELNTGRVRELKQINIFGGHSPEALFEEDRISEEQYQEYNKVITQIQMLQGPNTQWYSWRYWLDDWIDIDDPRNADIRDTYFEPLDSLYPPLEMDVEEYRKEKGLTGQMKVKVGVDEAGRGSVLGPMIIGFVAFSEQVLESPDRPDDILLEDSKQLKAHEKNKARQWIQENTLKWKTVPISAEKIDEADSLTQLQKQTVFRELNTWMHNDLLENAEIVCDAFASNSDSFFLDEREKQYKVTLETSADENYESVASASILAKTRRDREVKEIENDPSFKKVSEKIGQKPKLGKGYPSSPSTIAWLESYAEWYLKNHDTNNIKWPRFVRTSWSTVDKIQARVKERIECQRDV